MTTSANQGFPTQGMLGGPLTRRWIAPSMFAESIFWSAHFWPCGMALVAATMVWIDDGAHADLAGWGCIAAGGLATRVWFAIMDRRDWSNRLLSLLGLRPADVYGWDAHIRT
jgi:hypothetical protein